MRSRPQVADDWVAIVATTRSCSIRATDGSRASVASWAGERSATKPLIACVKSARGAAEAAWATLAGATPGSTVTM